MAEVWGRKGLVCAQPHYGFSTIKYGITTPFDIMSESCQKKGLVSLVEMKWIEKRGKLRGERCSEGHRAEILCG